jgi:hypothetical protein
MNWVREMWEVFVGAYESLYEGEVMEKVKKELLK